MTYDRRQKLRAELLQFEGIGRNILERRIVALVEVLDAATELVDADDAAQQANGSDATAEDVRYEQAWEQLRATLRSL